MNHSFDHSSRELSSKKLLNGEYGKMRWSSLLRNECGRLVQGNNRGVESTDTIEFIIFNEVPTNEKFSYGIFVCDHCSLKSE